MKLPMIDSKLAPVGEFEVTDALLGKNWNSVLVHRLSVAYAANRRLATRKQLTRAEVKHSTAKLARQKGTGNARVGMSSSPIRRGGGRAFPNRPNENFSHQLNRKEYRLGMTVMLSQLAREKRLIAVDNLVAEKPKTKPVNQLLKKFAGEQRVLFVDTEYDHNFQLALRNIYAAKLVTPNSLNVVDLLKYERTVISKRAFSTLTERFVA